MLYFMILNGLLLLASLLLFVIFRKRATQVKNENQNNKNWNTSHNFLQWWKVNWYQIFAYLAIAISIIIISGVLIWKTI